MSRRLPRSAAAPMSVVAVVLSLLAHPNQAVAQSGPPPTPTRVVHDTLPGIAIDDPYRWLENLTDSTVLRWLHAQQDFTQSLLERLPGRSALERRLHELDNASPSIGGVQFGGPRLFYFKAEPGSDSRKLYVRDSLGAAERLLVDPERLGTAGGPHWAIDYFTPSMDGRYVAYGASAGGSENSILRVLDLTSGSVLPDSIDRAQFGGIAWRPDGRSFFYNRLQLLRPGDPPSRKYQRSRAYLHVLGRRADVPILGIGVTNRVRQDENDFPSVATLPGSPWAFAILGHGVRPEVTAYVARLDAVRGATTPWRRVVDVADSVTQFDVHGDDIYLLSHFNAPRFKVLRTTLLAPDPSRADVVVRPSAAVVTTIGVASDGLYVQKLDGGLGRLQRLTFNAPALQDIRLPFDGSLGIVTDPRRPGALLALESWVRSRQWLAYDPASGQMSETGLMPPSPIDFSGIDADEVRVRSYDGTMVPLSIVHRRGLPRDGTNPTYLDGYGAYGFSYDPSFVPMYMAWLERGGVFAVCHVRGGGEFGEEWHQAAREATKPNTWRDFIACAEYLTAERWTSADRLGGTGTSAGGIMIGRAITERPDLFRAAVPRVGATNPLRMMQIGESGPANRPEFGDPGTPAGARALVEMDAYLHVQAGTRYPALLLTTGMNDPRVDTWVPAKMAARLQASSTSGLPVLLRVDFDAGHGLGSTKTQRERELADTMSFLLWQFGASDFQPVVP